MQLKAAHPTHAAQHNSPNTTRILSQLIPSFHMIPGSRLVLLLSIGTIGMICTFGSWYNWCAASGLGLDLCHCYQLAHLVQLV